MSATIPKYLLVENFVKQAIETGLIAGKLPGERVIARQLGISYMTVRKAIENLVAEGLLYKIPARGTFVAGHEGNRKKIGTQTIGYFLDSGVEEGISSPYYSMIFNAIEKQAAAKGYSVVYFSDVTNGKFDDILARLDGVIATCLPRNEDIIQAIRKSLPVVVIDNSSSDRSIPSVIIDNFNAEIESVDHVCSLGHRRIGFMTGLDDSDIGRSRYEGYRSGLEKHGIELDETLVYRGNYSYEAGSLGAYYFLSLEQPPTAVICANDSMALGAIRRFGQQGLAVPRDISVIGFDDIAIASQIYPALTTVIVPVDDIARQSFDILERLINGEDPGKPHVSLPARLVQRNTCARPRSDTDAA